MLPGFCTDTITVVRAPWVEERGSRRRDWTQAERHEVAGCSIQPGETISDMSAARAQSGTVRWNCYAPAGSDIQDGDRVEWRGGTYELNGAPQTWPLVEHMTFSLVEWKG